MISAHIAGIPVEEMLPTFAGPGAGLVLVRVWISLKLKRDREPEE
jgi:hypothetical protein